MIPGKHIQYNHISYSEEVLDLDQLPNACGFYVAPLPVQSERLALRPTSRKMLSTESNSIALTFWRFFGSAS
jgi:hypothetical protein